MAPGLTWWRNRYNPFHVLRLHYSADPEKDPHRQGREWYAQKSNDMGGAQSSGWQREYEIDFRAQAGAKVFSHFDPSRHIVPIRVNPLWSHRWVIFDYGLRNPTAMLVIATDEQGRHEVELEYYERGRSVRESCYLCHKLIFELYTPAELLNDVHFRDDELLIENREKLEAWEASFFEGTISDPTMAERREKDSKTVLERFSDGGWYLGKGNRAVGGLEQVNTWFKDDKLFIQRRCVQTVREVSYLVWADHTDPTLNFREREVDKNNHTTDILKMFANLFPVDSDRPTPNSLEDAHRIDSEAREAMERAEWEEESAMLHPSLGGGW